MNKLMPVVGLILIAILCFFAYAILAGIGSFLASMDSDIGKQVIAVSGAIVIAAITVVLGQYLKSRAEIEASHRERKIEVYERFIGKLMDTFYSTNAKIDAGESDDLVSFLQQFQTELIMRGDKKVLQAYIAWKGELASVDVNSVYATDELIKAIRKDLGFSNFGLDKGFFTHFWLRSSTLFLESAKSNPKLTLKQLADMEREQQRDV